MNKISSFLFFCFSTYVSICEVITFFVSPTYSNSSVPFFLSRTLQLSPPSLFVTAPDFSRLPAQVSADCPVTALRSVQLPPLDLSRDTALYDTSREKLHKSLYSESWREVSQIKVPLNYERSLIYCGALELHKKLKQIALRLKYERS